MKSKRNWTNTYNADNSA